MKPILIDALHICMGGGLMILNHLVSNLIERKVNFYLLKDERCPRLADEDKIGLLSSLSSDRKSRKAFYERHASEFSKVLCFGNIPPQIKLQIPVYTYIHNVSLLKIPSDYSLKKKLTSYIKKAYIRNFAKNTDTWIVQTSNTAQLVKENLRRHNQPILEFPFYNIPSVINYVPKGKRFDYCFIGDYTSAKGHEYLIKAWIKLHQMGIYPCLHLTVSEPIFLPVIKDAQGKGVKIINHGKVPFSEIVKIYNSCKAIVYPSLNESLGLGIVEGVEAGCDIIGSDLPFLHSVCRPSRTFMPCDSNSIAEAILSYEKHNQPSSSLLIRDMISDFIDFLLKD